MLLSYLTDEAYKELLNNVEVNAELYLSQDEWLNNFFKGKPYSAQSTVQALGAFTPSYTNGEITDEEKSENDLINTRILYDTFKKLTPLQASNKYMWTYMCHAIPECRKYILNRWTDMRKNTIKTRFFVTDIRHSLFDNAISRLWWYAHLTYDETSINKYALTEVLLSNQTICTDFMDTYNSRNVIRAKDVLGALKVFKEELGTSRGLSEYFRDCNKYLNRYAAVSSLDFLEPEEIRDIALTYS